MKEDMFQTLIGTVKSHRRAGPAARQASFQTLIGTVKSVQTEWGKRSLFKFQTLIGTVKRSPPLRCWRRRPRFKPS